MPTSRTNKKRLPDVRRSILDEAVRLFAMNGYQGTSIQAVADAVGIKSPSLLYYYGSKSELREAVLDDMISHWKEALPGLISRAASGGDRFGSLVESLVDFFTEDRNRARLTVREMLDRPQEIGERCREHLGPWFQLISEYIEMGKRSGIVNPMVEPERYILQVIFIVVGTAALSDVASEILEDDSAWSPSEGIVAVARDLLFVESYRARIDGKSGGGRP